MVNGAPVTQFNLVDHDGNAVDESDYAGSYLLVYFGFTHCQIVCPRSLSRLSAVLDELGTIADPIRALYITVDPERDTPKVMRDYLVGDYPRFTGLTGTAEQIDAAKHAFRVFAERKADSTDPDGYKVPHTAISYLMSPDGRYIDHFTDVVEEMRIRTRIAHALASAESR